MTDLHLVLRLEELTLNALPSLQTLHYDGWVLRFADGFMRRANSINMLYSSALDLNAKVDYCEAVYGGREFPHGVVFKMTPLAPPELEPLLRARGYVEDSLTNIQTVKLPSSLLPNGEGERLAWHSPLLQIEMGGEVSVEIVPSVSEAWLDVYFRINTAFGDRRATFTGMLAAIQPQTGYATVVYDGAIIAVGLGVVEDGIIGLYDIQVDSAYRRRGVGSALVSALLRWGVENGAHTAYLQVMDFNKPALALYAGLGFTTLYTYRYLQKPIP